MTFPLTTSPQVFGLNAAARSAAYGTPDTAPDVIDGVELDAASDALAMDPVIEQAYNEEAFRYFLGIERTRADLSGRPFLLLLIDLKQSTPEARLEDRTARQIFAALGSCLRETDFVGWYRQGRVAGGVLTQHAGTVAPEMVYLVSQRVRVALAETLSIGLTDRIQVRVYQVPAPVGSR